MSSRTTRPTAQKRPKVAAPLDNASRAVRRLLAAEGDVAVERVTEQIPAIAPQGTGTERPIACFVDRAGRASVGLFVGDYLTDDGTDQALFTKHLASVVNAAGTAS